MYLHTTGAAFSSPLWNNTAPTDSVFSLNNGGDVNGSGATYVAYLFAHDEPIFGDDADQSIIKCGSYTGNGSSSGPIVDLGWEPQWLLVKQSSISGANWVLIDNMRGFTADGVISNLYANSSSDEAQNITRIAPLSNGFQPRFSGYEVNQSGETYIYIAIRRGPMKTPEDATEVFESVAYTGDQSTNRVIGSTVLTDAFLLSDRDATSSSWTATYAHYFFDRLRGYNSLSTASADSESTGWNNYFNLARNVGWDTSTVTSNTYLNKTSTRYVSHNFRRAPGFFDVVAYQGTGVAHTENHNLGVVPEMMIIRHRNRAGQNWCVYHKALGNFYRDRLNLDIAANGGNNFFNSTDPTSSVFTVGTDSEVNNSASGYIAYLFASCPGVSKVGSYTGTGSDLSVNCDFAAGARFVLIKRTDASGDWWVFDTARGIVSSGNDPALRLNLTNAEVTSTDYLEPNSNGFTVTSTAGAGLNANGGSYIYLAIA